MRCAICLLAIVMLAGTQVSALELVVNGQFEQDLSLGWNQSVAGTGALANRGTTYHPDDDYEGHCYKPTGSGYGSLEQTIPIPSTDLEFSVDAEFYSMATSSAWAVSAVLISYLDESGFALGKTAICAPTANCPWTGSKRFHMIPAAVNVWETYSFNVANELGNLSGVDPAAVKKIGVELLAYVADC